MYKPKRFLSRMLYNLTMKLGTKIMKHPVLYYILNFTWGSLFTILGYLIFIVMLPFGKAKKYHYIPYIHLKKGEGWGFEQGATFIVAKDCDIDSVKEHEFGHTIQNCIFGPFQLFIVTIPSVIRYWYRYSCEKKGKELKTYYDDIWFEHSASDIGLRFRTYNSVKKYLKK